MNNGDADNRQDPIVVGIKRAAGHLSRAGFEIIAAFGEVTKAVVTRVRPPESDKDDNGPERIIVD